MPDPRTRAKIYARYLTGSTLDFAHLASEAIRSNVKSIDGGARDGRSLEVYICSPNFLVYGGLSFVSVSLAPSQHRD